MCKVVVIAASRGGVGALQSIVAPLRAPCAATLFIVLHTGPHPSIPPEILGGSATLPVLFPVDRTPIQPGHIYVAPPDQHLLVQGGQIRLSHGSKVKHSRPAADPLFESVAAEYGKDVVGVVLTGWDGDGANGLRVIKERGGVAIVQDPREAIAPDMPLTAIAADHHDCLPLRTIAERVGDFCAAHRAPASP